MPKDINHRIKCISKTEKQPQHPTVGSRELNYGA